MIAVPSAYTQLLGLGLLWVSFHCAGMCGPLLIGLDVAGAARGLSAWRGALRVLAYQGGRALTYAWLGGACGLVGARLDGWFTRATALLAMLVGLLSIVRLLRRRRAGGAPVKLRRPARLPLPALAAPLRRLISRLAASRSPLYAMALGSIMGFLPCMLVVWALGLAALTGSAGQGALLLLLLVAMTTPVLLCLGLLPRLALLCPRGRAVIAPYLPALSGVWLFLCGGAAAGLWPHAHLGISLLGRHFMVMFF